MAMDIFHSTCTEKLLNCLHSTSNERSMYGFYSTVKEKLPHVSHYTCKRNSPYGFQSTSKENSPYDFHFTVKKSHHVYGCNIQLADKVYPMNLLFLVKKSHHIALILQVKKDYHTTVTLLGTGHRTALFLLLNKMLTYGTGSTG